MPQQIINLGAIGSGAGGDSARTAFEKAIANFAELYIAALPGTAAQKKAARDMFGLGDASTRAVLGTVSQSGGVPTGAIIERGSNANGVYWRFAGGLQVCITVEKVRPAEGGKMVFEWPARFAGKPTTSTTVIPTYSWETPLGQYGYTWAGEVYFVGAGGANRIFMQAVGYWHN